MEQSSLESARRSFASDLLSGAYADTSSAEAEAEALGLDLIRPHFAVLLAGAPSDSQGALLEALLNCETPQQLRRIGAVLVESRQVFVICFADEDSALEAFASQANALARAQKQPAALSALHSEFEELPSAYLEATAAYESRFFRPAGQLLSFTELPLTEKSGAPSSR